MIRQRVLAWLAGPLARLHLKRLPVTCEYCPNWRFHSLLKAERPMIGADGRIAPQPFTLRVGLCRLDRAQVFQGAKLGFAFRGWIAADTCARHPRYNARILPGSDLEFRPGETKENAGFNRAPTYAEALKFAPVMDAYKVRAGFPKTPGVAESAAGGGLPELPGEPPAKPAGVEVAPDVAQSGNSTGDKVA